MKEKHSRIKQSHFLISRILWNVYEKQTEIERTRASASRVEKNGVKNSLIFDRLQHLKWDIESYKQNQVVTLYNGASTDYNDAIHSFNIYVDYRNKQFTPAKTDAQIKDMIDTPLRSLKRLGKAAVKLIWKTREIMRRWLNSFPAYWIDLSKPVKEAQRDWLVTYFFQSKSGRKSMFYERMTLFGIPIK